MYFYKKKLFQILYHSKNALMGSPAKWYSWLEIKFVENDAPWIYVNLSL